MRCRVASPIRSTMVSSAPVRSTCSRSDARQRKRNSPPAPEATTTETLDGPMSESVAELLRTGETLFLPPELVLQFQKGVSIGPFLRAAPGIGLLLGVWSAGEMLGYLKGRP